jgi:hypothetical protein
MEGSGVEVAAEVFLRVAAEDILAALQACGVVHRLAVAAVHIIRVQIKVMCKIQCPVQDL